MPHILRSLPAEHAIPERRRSLATHPDGSICPEGLPAFRAATEVDRDHLARGVHHRSAAGRDEVDLSFAS